MTVVYRWFLDCPFTKKGAVLFQNLGNRFLTTTIMKDIVSEVIRQALKKRLISGKQLFINSTPINASANKRKSEHLLKNR